VIYLVSIPYWSDFNQAASMHARDPAVAGFNPILVRFQQYSVYVILNSEAEEFQSHIGPISTSAHTPLNSIYQRWFQSHIGPISTRPLRQGRDGVQGSRRFNPILVRFQQVEERGVGRARPVVSIPYWSDFNRSLGSACALSYMQFQSHIGPISTRPGR